MVELNREEREILDALQEGRLESLPQRGCSRISSSRSTDTGWHPERPGLPPQDVNRHPIAWRSGLSHNLSPSPGDRLGWREHGEPDARPMFEARSLLEVALAVRGWPLIRSDEAWPAQPGLGFSDIGGPEGLAFEIRRFEELDREHGRRVETPCIPGLAR